MKIHVITHFLISNDIHCNFGQCYEKDVNIYIGLQTQGNQSLVVQYRFCLAVVFFDQGVYLQKQFACKTSQASCYFNSIQI